MLTELTIKEFINKVLSNDPVPGGGSVSALNGALATSLAAMVANLSLIHIFAMHASPAFTKERPSCRL